MTIKCEKSTTDKFYGEYRNVKFEIIKTPENSDYFNNQRDFRWCHYIYLNIDKVIPNKELANKFWLLPKEMDKRSGNRIYYNYDVYPIKGIVFHGGCTWYSKEQGFDGSDRIIKIGCDYQHLWDVGKFWDLDYVLNEVKETIDSLWNITPINKWCSYCGKYSPNKEFRQDKPCYCMHCKDRADSK